MRVRVITFNEKDLRGDIFLPGSVPPVEVVVTEQLDTTKPAIGSAIMGNDGFAELRLNDGYEFVQGSVVAIGFRTVEESLRDDGVRVIEKMEPIVLGVTVRRKNGGAA